jgi:hypothetical protein
MAGGGTDNLMICHSQVLSCTLVIRREIHLPAIFVGVLSGKMVKASLIIIEVESDCAFEKAMGSMA